MGTDPSGFFAPIELGNGVLLDYYDYVQTGTSPGMDKEIPSLHFAFVVSEEEFDAAFARIAEAGLPYYAHPHKATETAGQIRYYGDHHRGVYFPDPDGHVMELLTAPTMAVDPSDNWWAGPYRPAPSRG